MGKGDCIYIDAKYFKQIDPTLEFVNKGSSSECCYELPVFWSNDGDKFHHDFSSWVVFCDETILNVTIYLEKDNCSGFVPVATLTDNSYGTLYELGFIDNRLRQKAVGYLIDWNLVNAEFGHGDYRLRFLMNYKLGITTEEKSLTWTLKKWHEISAGHTIRLEWESNGEQGWWNKGRVDFLGNEFYGQIRLPKSKLGKPKDSIEQEFVRYQDGRDEFKSRTITEKYTLEVVKAPYMVHNYLQILPRQAYKVKVTDYNLLNAVNFKELEVVFISGSEPNWQLATDKATVVYEMEEYIKNKRIYT